VISESQTPVKWKEISKSKIESSILSDHEDL